MLFCPACGNENIEKTDKFCDVCGSALNTKDFGDPAVGSLIYHGFQLFLFLFLVLSIPLLCMAAFYFDKN